MKSATAAMTRADVACLARLGVPEILVDHFQMVGLARVRETRDGTYEPDDGGRWAFITPCCVHFANSPETSRPDAAPLVGNLVDLVAWCERLPEAWRLRVGSATWLGAIEYLASGPVPIWRSPLSWLRNRCIGLVPLTRNRSELYHLLSICNGGIFAEDDAHAAQLTDILERPYPVTKVLTDRGERRRAA
jgi:hypothetical protein